MHISPPAFRVVRNPQGYRHCVPASATSWQKEWIPNAAELASVEPDPDMLALPTYADSTSRLVAEIVRAIFCNRAMLLNGEPLYLPCLKDNPDASTVMKAFVDKGWQVTETDGVPQIAVVLSDELCAAR